MKSASGVLVVGESEWDGSVRERLSEVRVAIVEALSYTLDKYLDLAALADTFTKRSEVMSVTYEPAENHWLQANFAPDDTYVAFYRSGRCSITGIDSVEHFEDVVERVNAVMRDLLEFEFTPESKVVNIVVTSELDRSIHLEELAVKFGLESVEYEPEQFPGLFYHAPDSNAVITVFSTGKIMCTGLSDVKIIVSVLEDFSNKINQDR